MRLSVVHPGTQYAIRVAEQLALRGHLHEFWTGIGFARTSTTFKIIEGFLPRLAQLLENRVSAVLKPNQVKTLVKHELALLARQHCGRLRDVHFIERNRGFQFALPQSVLRESDGIIGYDSSSWILASRCNKIGKPLILDRSIGHSAAKANVFEKLRNRYPEWRLYTPPPLAAAKQIEAIEHTEATVIVVPSTFVADALTADGVDASKIVTLPFGTNTNLFTPPRESRPIDRLRFLFVGGISARKGVPDLLRAWVIANLSDAELWLAGAGELPVSEKLRLPPSVRFLGKLSRMEVARRMSQANALLFPSHFEGLAQVQIEALASGLPVIGTHESGASDIVVQNFNGLIVEAGNVEQLVDLLRHLSRNRQVLSLWEDNIRKYPQDLSWEAYGTRWIQAIAPRIASR